MRRITVYQIDSFTKEKLKGNPAGVVSNAELLTEEEMQSIARELNNSETAFILSPESPDHEVRIRFFTPSTEVPSCGHATVAAHYVRAVENNYPPRTFNHKIGIGVLPVEIEKCDNDYKVIMTQGKPEFLSVLEGENRQTLLNALNLSSDDIDSRAPIQIVDTGHSKVMLPIKKRDKLNSLQPDFNSLKNLSKIIGCNGYYVFTFDSDDSEILIHGRMFAPAIGINEDPVTGNANGPAGAYIAKYKLTNYQGNQLYFKAMQGEVIKRTGIVHVYVEMENGIPVKTRIGGTVVVAFKTEILL